MRKLIALIISLATLWGGTTIYAADTTHSVAYIRSTFQEGKDEFETSGSGFFFDRDLIMTASHVVHLKEGQKRVMVEIWLKSVRTNAFADVIYDDPVTDVAIVKLKKDTSLLFMQETEQLHIDNGNDPPKKDDKFSIVGFPVTDDYRHVYSISTGTMVESLPFTDTFGHSMWLTNKVKKGYSGGPVINDKGNVVGILWGSCGELGSAAVSLKTIINHLQLYYLTNSNRVNEYEY